MLHRLRRLFQPDPAQRAAEFWRLFAANEDTFRGITSMPPAEAERNLKLLLKPLHAYHPGLELLFGQPAPGEHYLIISAGGVREDFPKVDALVAQAPELPDWRVIALKPPVPETSVIEVGEQRFDRDLVTFAVVEVPDEPEALAIHVFHEPYPEELQERHHLATFLLLDFLLGERSVAEDLRYIETRPLPRDLPTNILRPLSSLPALIAKRRARSS